MPIAQTGTQVATAVHLAMQKRKINTPQLALKISEKQDIVKRILNPTAPKVSQEILARVERHLGVKLRGNDIGQPTEKGKKMDEEDEAARKAEEAKERAAKPEVAETQEA